MTFIGDSLYRWHLERRWQETRQQQDTSGIGAFGRRDGPSPAAYRSNTASALAVISLGLRAEGPATCGVSTTLGRSYSGLVADSPSVEQAAGAAGQRGGQAGRDAEDEVVVAGK
jgi:hypothetical protein